MPEAIATQKRKFHRLLDTFTTYANTTTASTTAPATPLTAREKLEQASERVRKRQRQDGSLSSIESRLHNTSTTSPPRKTTTKDTQKATPAYSPWSQETFLQRLQTFSKVSLWHPKPEGIDEVVWAKRGWMCVDVNTVACSACGRKVIVKLDRPKRAIGDDEDENEDEDDSLEQALTARYKHEIVDGHAENCLWRKSACKEDIYRLQVVRPAIWQPAVKHRYSSLLGISKSIQEVELSQTLPSKQMLDELQDVLESSKESTHELQLQALGIALHGWRGSTELNADLLNCDACFQRIGLWMYQPGYRSRTSGQGEIVILNLIEMHREYCPWRNADNQQASGSLAGLNASEILVKVIATYIKERRRKTDEQSGIVTETAELADPFVETPKLSRKEVDEQDRARESKLQKLKRMLSIKRTSKAVSSTS